MKNIALTLLAAVILAAAVILVANYSAPDVYNGTDVNLRLHNDNALVIENVATVGEDALIGKITKAPLGWKYSNYFTTPPTSIKAGNWIIDDGDYTAHMYSDEEMKITVGKTTSNIIDVTLAVLLVGFWLWLLMWLITS
ncbi:MAG: hypothetical protein UW20_C0005G0050 [Candidatus Woesebacteria bacterium GW2011_GWB1_44_11]|uniref:Uncharacterized protein n=1 Tax=Candidatus Woesebacteria bacterium GW2011_GWB1_44_11 TaxID=1618579 RepID=A0A837IBC9_9BACT|nr:MAG: hypothetical protein UW20_C0005G0050 [Candidatus Woesebacteria bacterium GW2011_GWB1_44_11]